MSEQEDESVRANVGEDVWSLLDDSETESRFDLLDKELSQKLDEYSAPSGVDIKYFKRCIAGDFSKYTDGKTDEMWKQIVAIYCLLGANSHNAEQQLLTKSPETLQALFDQIYKLVQIINSTDEERRKDVMWDIQNIMVSFTAAFDEKIFDDSTVDKIVEYAEQSAVQSPHSKLGGNLGLAIKVAGESKDPSCIPIFLDYVQELERSPDNDLGNYQECSDLLRRYFSNHGIDEQRLRGFQRNIFPLIRANDPEVESLSRAGNSWGMRYGDFGISDFVAHGLSSEINPKNTRDLIQIYREIPTSDFAKFEQNRKDALALQWVLYTGRDFIHDERPGVHELLSAMLEYYDTKDDEALHAEKTAQLEKIIADRMSSADVGYYTGSDSKDLAGYALDLNNYELVIEKKINSDSGPTYYNDKAVDILRRLVKNTEQTTLEKPHTEDERLNSLFEDLNIRSNERTGEVAVDWRQVGELVAYANQILLNKQGEIGMRPSMVQALAYIDKMATYAMREVGDKDWLELPFDPSFKEFVKFRDLTSSNDKFNERSFEEFWNMFSNIPNWPDGVQGSYKVLSQHILDQVNKMAQYYTANPHTAYLAGSLWSGNLNHELIGLADARPSSQRYDAL